MLKYVCNKGYFTKTQISADKKKNIRVECTFNVTVMTMTVKTNVPKVQFPNIFKTDRQTTV